MASCKEWLNQKFVEWEKAQGRKQSYYSFSRELGVSQSSLAQWMDGSAIPNGDDLLTLAEKLGPEIYESIGMPRPHAQLQRLTVAFPGLPAGLRDRLTNAIWDADQYLKANHLPAESVDAKKIVVEIFGKWGIRLTD
jgi:transcriptional regulator with XRE-family HTH domain